MSLKTNINTYSQSFWDLANQIETQPEFKLSNFSKSLASNLRFQFYGFRKQLALDHFQSKNYPNTLNCIPRIVEEGNNKYSLVFHWENNTPTIMALTSALKDLGVQSQKIAEKEIVPMEKSLTQEEIINQHFKL